MRGSSEHVACWETDHSVILILNHSNRRLNREINGAWRWCSSGHSTLGFHQRPLISSVAHNFKNSPWFYLRSVILSWAVRDFTNTIALYSTTGCRATVHFTDSSTKVLLSKYLISFTNHTTCVCLLWPSLSRRQAYTLHTNVQLGITWVLILSTGLIVTRLDPQLERTEVRSVCHQ